MIYHIPSAFLDPSTAGDHPNCLVIPHSSTKEVDRSRVFMEMHVISFLLEGEKRVLVSDQQLGFDPSQFILLKQGRCLMTEKLSVNGRFRSILFFFNHTFLLRFLRRYQLEVNADTERNSFALYPKDALLDAIAHSLEPYFERPESLTPEIAALKTSELLLQIVHQYGSQTFSFLLESMNQRAGLAFQQIVEQNIANKLTTAELAFLCNMSPSTFRRQFLKTYGKPPGQWYTQKRLEKAAYLLRVEGKSASEIYLDIGFESLSSFIQSFKHQYGTTPKQFQVQA